MKKKLLLILVPIILAVVIGVVALIATGSKDRGFKDNPDTKTASINNGGIAVQKGDYLYYINGFISTLDLESGDNDWGDTSYSAIYRTKLNSDNTINYDNDGFLEKTEVVVPKIVGHENAGFYVIDDYIYYTTKNNSKDQQGNSLTTKTDFYRININGKKSTNQKIYTSISDSITVNDWTIYTTNHTHYLVVKDDTTLISVIVNGKKIGNITTLAQDVTSTALLKNAIYTYENSNIIIPNYSNYVYYTRNYSDAEINDGASGNILARVKLGTSTEVITTHNATAITIKEIKNNSIYYTKASLINSNLLYRRAITSEMDSPLSAEIQLTNNEYTEYYLIDYSTTAIGNQVLANTGNLFILINGLNSTPITHLTGATIHKFTNNTVIYTKDNNLYLFDVTSTSQPIQLPKNDKTLKTDTEHYINYDGRNVYIFAEYTSESTRDTESTVNHYLNRIDLHTTTPKTEFIGKFKTSHLPAQPDNEGKSVGDEDYEYWIK